MTHTNGVTVNKPQPRHAMADAAPQVSFRQALRFWLKLGLISFGGPAGQIAIMHQELVEQKRWISEKRFLHALNFCMLLPGPEAQQLAIYMGWLLHRTRGGIAAGVLFVLPSLCILIGLSWLYVAFSHLQVVDGIFYGIKPAVTAIVLHAAYRIGTRSLQHRALWAIALAAFVGIFAFNIAFPVIVLAAGLLGWLGSKWAPAIFLPRPVSPANHTLPRPALIDDQNTLAPHMQFRWSRLGWLLLTGLMLWSLPMSLLIAHFGWMHPFSQMAWFFSKAALLTFGGAYAVLPYVYQGAINHYNWLTPGQMMDGLALGETTPGPLIMVVTFVGFMGAYQHAALGADQLFLAGACAAVIVSWFTFLPSFLFIFAGGPLIESTHNNLNFTAPLTAITAAVVGVILNLALFFSYHVVWPGGLAGGIDWLSVLLILAALLALWRFNANVIYVIVTCGVIGLLATLAT